MATGTVKWFNATKGYGFVQPDEGGGDVIVKLGDNEKVRNEPPREGEKVSFSFHMQESGKMAAQNVQKVG